jgi:hypothetical protein
MSPAIVASATQSPNWIRLFGIIGFVGLIVVVREAIVWLIERGGVPRSSRPPEDDPRHEA